MANFSRDEKHKLTFEGAAEFYWGMLMQPVQGR